MNSIEDLDGNHKQEIVYTVANYTAGTGSVHVIENTDTFTFRIRGTVRDTGSVAMAGVAIPLPAKRIDSNRTGDRGATAPTS